MGTWKTARGKGGDRWADEMSATWKRLSELTIKNKDPVLADHEITMADLADLVEFCTRGHIITWIRHPVDEGRPLSQLHCHGVETYTNRGQIHCEGKLLRDGK